MNEKRKKKPKNKQQQNGFVLLYVYVIVLALVLSVCLWGIQVDNTLDYHCQSHRFDEFKSVLENFGINAFVVVIVVGFFFILLSF